VQPLLQNIFLLCIIIYSLVAGYRFCHRHRKQLCSWCVGAAPVAIITLLCIIYSLAAGYRILRACHDALADYRSLRVCVLVILYDLYTVNLVSYLRRHHDITMHATLPAGAPLAPCCLACMHCSAHHTGPAADDTGTTAYYSYAAALIPPTYATAI